MAPDDGAADALAALVPGREPGEHESIAAWGGPPGSWARARPELRSVG